MQKVVRVIPIDPAWTDSNTGKTYRYNVQVWNIDDDHTCVYTGEGRFCETCDEVTAYRESILRSATPA